MVILAGCGVIAILCSLGWLRRTEMKRSYFVSQGFEPLSENSQGYPEYRHLQTRIIFVRLPAGTFLMGSPEDEKGRKKDEHQHRVTLSSFLIARYEVDQAQWMRIMEYNPSRHKGNNLPVTYVSWLDCQEFCRRTGLKLPTEAQWEYACRAGTEGPYGGTGNLDDVAWHENNRDPKLHPVGQKQPNAFGLHDMHGNVWEWCEDTYDKDFYRNDDASKDDPVCRWGLSNRVVRRGGCYSSPARYCRSAYRRSSDPSKRTKLRGFRPAVTLK